MSVASAPPKKRSTGIVPTRAEDFPGWYQEAVRAGELATMAHVRGSMVIKPWGYGIWEQMQSRLDAEIRRRGHENVYFPVLIPLSYFQKEAEHIEGFAKEMAVVTHHRLEERDGKIVPTAEFAEPLVVRPTSETIIGESMAEWINSYRDLPLLLNQWANVVRWEMRPRIFLRTTEFLWQEGHTAHATGDEALAEALDIHRMYQDFAEQWLAMPVIPGEKSPSERFPGALRSFTIEAMMQDGKALQAGTSHYLGQNFARAAEITFLDADGERKLVHTTSWGVSTRLIGGVVMEHGDDEGVRLPPRIAPHQVVIVPMLRGVDTDGAVREYAAKVASVVGDARDLYDRPIRVHVDLRQYRPQDKRWQWTKKGAPVIIEVGPRDIAGEEVTWRARHEVGEVRRTPLAEFGATVSAVLQDVQDALLTSARRRLDAGIHRDVTTFAQAEALFRDDPRPGFVLAKWCGSPECEIGLKKFGVTIRTLPENMESAARTCLVCGRPASVDAVFGQSY
jgi:prolyl-tRNA synthetase